MAETKPITTKDADKAAADRAARGERELRTVEQTINEPLPPPTPTQEEADAIISGEPLEEPPPEGETEAARKKREAKAASDQAEYKTR